ncbi:MAG: hypothetical protein IPO71_08925 [Nitrosomonas sp.]|nr:hypothetical protein [Nitrosomonas sp.]
MKQINKLISFGFFAITYHASVSADSDQWASAVLGFSSQYSTTSWSAAKALGVPDVTAYADNSNAWTSSSQTGTLEYIALSYPIAVYAYGATIRETYGNGFVYKVDVKDTGCGTVWQTDSSHRKTVILCRLECDKLPCGWR